MSARRTLRLAISYDGAGFSGWARQPGLRTVQGVFEDAVHALWPDAPAVAVAGRTDAGVHASGQVASVEVEGGPPTERVASALNARLPQDLAVQGCSDAGPDFHARFSARSRTYEYALLRARYRDPLLAGRVWHVPRPLDTALLDACAALLPGTERDYRAFTPAQTHHRVFRRHVLEAAWSHAGERSTLRIGADSFLHHMVRVLVGTMVETAAGTRDPEAFDVLLEGAARSAAGRTAPAHGLCLVEVRYGDAGTVR